MRWIPAVLVSIALVCASASAAAAEDTRPLSEQGADNLTAFARLLGYLRFFHPSDQAADANWNRVAVAGIEAVEGAPDAASLARALEDFVRLLAPTVRIVPRGERPEMHPALRPPEDGKGVRIVAWRHYGGHFDGTSKVFSSERIDNASPPGFGTLVQSTMAEALRGKRARLRAWVRAEMEAGGTVQLGLRVDRPGGAPGFFDNMADRPIRSTDWRQVEIEGEVAPDAMGIVVLLVMTGSGRVWLDEVSLEPADRSKRWNDFFLANGGFDERYSGELPPPGWYFPYESIRAGYHLEQRRGSVCLQGGCAEISSDAIAAPRFHRPDELLEADLGGGVTAFIPTMLYADAGGTLPHVTAGAPPPPWAGADPAPDTRTSRLAAVALAWGILAHLHPTLDVPAEAWAAELHAILPAVAAAADAETFGRAVRPLLGRVRDPLAMNLEAQDAAPPHWLPVAWDWIEGRLVITAVEPGLPEVRPGDVVREIDGQPTAEVVAREEALASAPTSAILRRLTLLSLNLGPAGSSVRLRLERPGTEPMAVTLQRRAGRPPLDAVFPPVAEPRPGVLYVDLRRIDDTELDHLLPQLTKAKGVVFDLRGSTDVGTVLLSHLAERTAASSNWQVPVALRPDRQGLLYLTSVWTIEPRRPRIAGRVAFLTDARTLGYGETLMEMVDAYGWAEIVGAATAGSNGNPNRCLLPGGWTLHWTGQRVLKHDGTLLNGTGVLPTRPAARTVRGVAAGRDEVVERAVEVVARR
jgi:C-terminal processing protease CtpA/Prc